MGLDDDYSDSESGDVSIPHSGHEGHMMGEWNGEVSQHEVEDIMRVNNISCGGKQ